MPLTTPHARSRTFIGMLACVALALTSACASSGTLREPDPPTYLVVQNRNFLDMNVYVWRGSQRLRLGTAPGSSTTRMRIPATLIFGATPLRFQADPVGGTARPMSMEVIVSPGEEVGIAIPP